MLRVSFYAMGWFINSQLSRLNTARGYDTGLVIVGPAKVKTCKSILFTEDVPEVKIKKHLVDEVNTLNFMLL